MADGRSKRRRRDRDDADSGRGRARAFWSGTLTFGLVSIPVDLYPASRPTRTSLRTLGPSGIPLSRRYYEPETGDEVPTSEVRRGFEAAQMPAWRGRTHAEVRDELKGRYPGLSEKEAFRRGFERGQVHARKRRPPLM